MTPLPRPGKEPPHRPNKATPMVQRTHPRILCVEDDRTLARLLHRYLTREEFEVELAFDGEEALARLAREDFDLLLLDHSLPGCDGLEVLRILRGRGDTIPIIMVTGTGSTTMAVEAMKLGASDYIHKGMEGEILQLLTMRVRRVLAEHAHDQAKIRADEALRESQRRLDLTLKATAIGVWEWSVVENRMSWDETTCRLAGITPAEVPRRMEDYLTSVHEEDRSLVRGTLERHLASREDFQLEYRILRPDGEERYVAVRGRVVCDAQGAPQRLLGVCQDVTERRLAEEELVRQRFLLGERLKEMQCLYAVSRLLEIPGLSVRQLVEKAADIIPRAWTYNEVAVARVRIGDHEAHSANYRDSLWKLAFPVQVHGRVVGAVEVGYAEPCPAGDEGPFSAEERMLLKDVAERLGRAVERSAAEAEARTLRQRMEFILAATKTGMDIIDENHFVRYVDPGWGASYGDFTGRKCHEYFHGRRAPCDGCGLVKALETKETVVYETQLTREGDRPVQVTTFPFQDESGKWMVAQVCVDVSERKRMERELVQAHKLEAVGQLAAGIAHEINTPTQYIGDNIRFLGDGFADLGRVLAHVGEMVRAARGGAVPPERIAELASLLEEAEVDYLREEIPAAIRQALEGIEQVATIVRAMKEFSHPADEEKQPVDLNRALQSTLTVSRNTWKHLAQVNLDLEPALPPVQGLAGQLNQVFVNLIVNAAQAIAARGDDTKKGAITIRTRYDGDEVEVAVEDSGVGIPEAVSDRVFDPFFTTKEVGEGSGQGLSIAHAIVTRGHGGTIRFHSTPGEGTTFIVRLPCEAAAGHACCPEPAGTEGGVPLEVVAGEGRAIE